MKEESRFEKLLARALSPFGRVEAHEALSAAVLAIAVFILLTAYYLLKTAREPLILIGGGGAEVKSYAMAGQAALLLVVVQVYGEIARRVGRVKLLAIVYVFFAANLVVFAALVRAGVNVGVPFFLWVGVFNYTAIAQFWAFAADVYRPEQGQRLFAILGIGSSVGAVAGARLAKSLAVLGPATMMTTAAAMLLVCVVLYAWVERRLVQAPAPRPAEVGPPKEEPLSKVGPFQLLLRDRYLMLVAALTLVLNWCNSSGEYILDRTLLAAVGDAQARGMAPNAFVSAFKADYFAWMNGAGVLLQLFAVSRIMTRYGVRAALFVMPVISFIGYGLVLVSPLLSLIRIAKVAENAVDYSLQNTARQALYLVTSRPEKYVGKTLVDTFLVRAGDGLSALVVLVGSRVGLPTQAFAAINVGLVAVWLVVLVALGREHARRAAESEEQVALEPAGA